MLTRALARYEMFVAIKRPDQRPTYKAAMIDEEEIEHTRRAVTLMVGADGRGKKADMVGGSVDGNQPAKRDAALAARSHPTKSAGGHNPVVTVYSVDFDDMPVPALS